MNQAQAISDRMHETFVTVHLVGGGRVQGFVETNDNYPGVLEADLLTIASQPSYKTEGPGFYTLIAMRQVQRVQLDYE